LKRTETIGDRARQTEPPFSRAVHIIGVNRDIMAGQTHNALDLVINTRQVLIVSSYKEARIPGGRNVPYPLQQ